jgi:hypothetical protein
MYFKLHMNLPDFHKLLISVLCCSSQSLPTSGVQGQLGGKHKEVDGKDLLSK